MTEALMVRLIERLESGEVEQLPAFAWPGGYEMIYYNSDMNTLCAECATRILKDPDSYCWEKPQYCRYFESGETILEPETCHECDRVIVPASDPKDWDESTWKAMGLTEQEWKDLCEPDYSGLDPHSGGPRKVSPTAEVIVQQSPFCGIGEEEPQQLGPQDPEYQKRYPYWH